MDRSGFADWLEQWIALWRKRKPERSEIEALFSEDASWAFQPYEAEPARGRTQVVDRWIDNIDPPGSWECHYEPLAVDGETAIAQGWSRYTKAKGAARDARYDKLLICRFTPDGRCRSLVEWYMEAPALE